MAEPRILSLAQIEQAIDLETLIPDVERGFIAYSSGGAVVPPVGYLAFEPPNAGDVHIKYGYIKGGEFYVVKIASGFGGVNDGMMLLFRVGTGEVAAILLDQGYLTDVRTAVAGAIAAKYLAPAAVTRIGILGSGVQARWQLRLLARVTECREVVLWARSLEKAERVREEMEAEGFRVELAKSPRDVAMRCNLIVTTTAARSPLFDVGDIRPGTHITALGADAPGKQELAVELVARADVVVADSREQCLDHGELSHAGARVLGARVRELGEVITSGVRGRENEEQITIADLTGVAVQDIAIATHVYGRVAGSEARTSR